MSYSFDELAERERRRWMQPWAIEMMSPAERQADLERWRERLQHRDRGLWNYHAVHAQRSSVNASPQLTARRQIEPASVRGAAPSVSELLKLKSDAAALRAQLAVIRREIATRKAHCRPPLTEADVGWQVILRGLARYQDACRKAGFNPDQPRVPAGNPGGGQWTDSGGGAVGDNTGGINDPRVHSDATPDNTWIPGAQYAENDTSRRIPVVLEDEPRFKHIKDGHIGRSDDQLLDELRTSYYRGLVLYGFQPAEGSFTDVQSANDLINQTIQANSALVDRVAAGEVMQATVEHRFGYRTGNEAFRADVDTDPYIRSTCGVRVVIRHDPQRKTGYRLLTAYPSNQRKQ